MPPPEFDVPEAAGPGGVAGAPAAAGRGTASGASAVTGSGTPAGAPAGSAPAPPAGSAPAPPAGSAPAPPGAPAQPAGRSLDAPPPLGSSRRRLTIVAVVAALALFVVAAAGMLHSGSAAADGCTGGGRGKITVAAAPDIAPALTTLAADYHPSGDATCGVKVVSATPAAVVDAAAHDWKAPWHGDRPDVWIPDASVWARYGATLSAVAPLLPSTGPSVASSPITIALPRPMAQALGWPRTPVRWSGLLGLLRDSRGWGAHGHADWGPIRLARTDARGSTDELQSLMAITAGATAPPHLGALTSGGVTSVGGESTLLALGTVPYRAADDTPALLAGLRAAGGGTAGLRYVSVLAASEQEVLAYDRSAPPIPLVGVAPADGSPVDDHPYLVLRGDGVGSPSRDSAAGFLDLLRGASGRQKLAAAGFRVAGTPTPDVSGTGPAAALTGVHGDVADLTVRMWEALRRPAYALFAFSTGASQGSSSLTMAKQGFLATLPSLFDNVDVRLWAAPGARGQPHRQLIPAGDLGSRLGTSTHRQAARTAVGALRPSQGATGVYDLVLAAYQQARADWNPARNSSVIVYTSGTDGGSSVTLPVLLDRLRALADPTRPVRLTVLVYGPRPNLAAMRAIVGVTGGVVFQNLPPGRGPITVLQQYAQFIRPADA